MAGLLDFLNSDDARLGIGLLAAGGPTTDPNQSGLGQRLAAGLQFADASRAQKMREDLMRSQMAENDAQAAARQAALARQQQMDAYYLGSGFGGGQANATGTGGQQRAAAIPEGAALKQAVGAPADAPRPPQGKFAEWSQQFNIPVDALVTDYVSNGGKGIADMLYKAGRPDIQVSNGYAYDKNSVKPGYLPQFNVSQDGKSSLTQIGPDGLPVVSAPRGAVETYRAYQGAQADYKPIKVYNPATGREEYTSEGAVVRNGPVTPMAGGTGNVQSSGYAGGDRNAANAESIRMMQSELQNPNLSPADKAAVQREIQRLQVQSGLSNAQVAQSGNYAAGPTSQEAASAKFNEKMATDQGDILTKSYTAANDAASALQGIQESRKAMAGGAFQGTGADAKLQIAKFGQMLGISLDPEKVANTDYLKSTLGNQLLEKAKTLGSNPSNADASRITDIVGSIGKDPQAMAKILDWQEAMARKSIEGHNTRVSQATANGFKPQFDLTVKMPEAQQTAPGRLKTPPSQADLQNTALKYKMTVDQVKQKLGIQ